MSRWQRRIVRHLYRWHRLLGVAAALFILLLAVTGVLLNHTSALGLDRLHLSARPLLAWYGIQPPGHVTFYPADTHFVSQWHERVLFDAVDLGNHPGILRGTVASNGLIAAALDNHLLLLLDDGRLVDILDHQLGLPTPIQGIGLTAQGAVVLATSTGHFIGDSELTHWQPTTTANRVHWSLPAIPPEPLRGAAENRYLGAGLPLERVVADLHSGRLFTRHGPLLMDLVALILIFSTLSGLWLWWRYHLRRP